MFTGIIEATSNILQIKASGGTQLITIKRPDSFGDLVLGCSIACDGICLTAVALEDTSFTVQVMNETLEKTNAGQWTLGRILNLERALKLGDRLDGHWVMGHIDRKAKFLRREIQSDTTYFHIERHPQDHGLLIPQGSIAVNGISLTIASLNSRDFSVALIRHTLENTNLEKLRTGDIVNLEYDALGKYVRELSK